MNCGHCSHFRRGEGGPVLGGRVSLDMIPQCACSGGYLNIRDNKNGSFTPPPFPIEGGVYGATWFGEGCFCSQTEGLMTPNLRFVACENYPIESFTTQIIFTVFEISTGITKLVKEWNDGVPVDDSSFYTLAPPDNGYSVGVEFYAYSELAHLDDPAVMSFGWIFKRPL